MYLFEATCLHIFVMTNACNMCCVYCQAQDSEQLYKGMIYHMQHSTPDSKPIFLC